MEFIVTVEGERKGNMLNRLNDRSIYIIGKVLVMDIKG